MNNLKKNQAEPQNVQQKVEATKALSLLDSIEKITVLAKDSGLSDEFFETIKPYSAVVAKTMQLTETQAALFAVNVGIVNFDPANEYSREYSRQGGIEHYSKCPPICLLRYRKDYAELVERKLLVIDDRGETKIHRSVFDSILNNKAYVPSAKDTLLDIDQLFADLESIFDNRCNRYAEKEPAKQVTELCDLLTRNVHLPFAAKMLKLKENVDDASFVLALYFCHRLVCRDYDTIGLNHFDHLFDKASYLRLKRSLLTQTNPLLKLKFIGNITNNGYTRGSDDFRLTDTARAEYLPEYCFSKG